MLDMSVIIPMYDVADYIEETIESLKRQNVSSVEFILVDDGSTDETLAIAKQTAGDDKRFLFIEQKNSGVSEARNNGIDVSRGKYIMFCDSDDYLADNCLELLYEAALANQADLTYGKIVRFDSEKQWYLNGHVESSIYQGEENLGDIVKSPKMFYSMGPCAKLYSRELVVGNYFPSDCSYGEDQLFTFKAYYKMKKIKFVNADIYYYRVREGENLSAVQTREEKAQVYLKSLETVFTRVMTFLQEDYTNSSYRDKEKILGDYLQRFIRFDWLPVFLLLLKKNPKEALERMLNLLYLIPSRAVIGASAFRWHMFVTLEKNEYLIPLKYWKEYQQLLKLTMDKHSEQALLAFGKSQPIAYKKSLKKAEKLSVGTFAIYKMKSYSRHIVKEYQVKKKIYAILFNVFKLLPLNNRVLFVNSRKINKTKNNFTSLYNMLIKEYKRPVTIISGNEKKFKTEWKKYYYLATSKYIVADDYYYLLYNLDIRGTQKFVQIWHANGAFKKFGLSSLEKLDSNTEEFEVKAHRQYTDVLCSSNAIKGKYSEAFGLPESKIRSIAHPRTDELFDENYKKDVRAKFYKKYPDLLGKEIYLYAPTFRGDSRQRQEFTDSVDWDNLDISANKVILLKYHPSVKKIKNLPENKAIKNVSNSPFDVNELMMVCDVLITDYSSVIFEYSLLSKPIIHYLAKEDLENYEEERGLFFDMEQYVYGEVADSNIALEKLINTALSIDEKRHEEFREFFMGNCKGDSTKKVIEELL